MAKNGDFSKKLLEDREFLNEFKETLKNEDGIDAEDEEISSIIKNIEKSLKNEKLIIDDELKNISGGINKSVIVKGSLTTIGAIVGDILGGRAGTFAGILRPEPKPGEGTEGMTEEEKKKHEKKLIDEYYGNVMTDRGIGKGLGIAGGAYGGYKLGALICKKFNIK